MAKIIILPIQEPWASMIADGKKPYEFRDWYPKWELGQTIWIVATGKAKTPREVIAVAEYGGTHQRNEIIPFVPRISFGKLMAMGWTGNTNAIVLNVVLKLKDPFTLKSIGIDRTPQKYMYLESDWHPEDKDVTYE